MDANTAHAMGSDIQIVDVREDHEWAAGRIEGAVHIPLAELLTRLGELDESRTIVTVCGSGGRSSRACLFLTSAGKSAENLDGGMRAWVRRGLPVTADGDRGGVR